jgi:hypothetical protein
MTLWRRKTWPTTSTLRSELWIRLHWTRTPWALKNPIK